MTSSGHGASRTQASAIDVRGDEREPLARAAPVRTTRPNPSAAATPRRRCRCPTGRRPRAGQSQYPEPCGRDKDVGRPPRSRRASGCPTSHAVARTLSWDSVREVQDPREDEGRWGFRSCCPSDTYPYPAANYVTVRVEISFGVHRLCFRVVHESKSESPVHLGLVVGFGLA